MSEKINIEGPELWQVWEHMETGSVAVVTCIDGDVSVALTNEHLTMNDIPIGQLEREWRFTGRIVGLSALTGVSDDRQS